MRIIWEQLNVSYVHVNLNTILLLILPTKECEWIVRVKSVKRPSYLKDRHHCPKEVVEVAPGSHLFPFLIFKFKLPTKQIHSQDCKRKHKKKQQDEKRHHTRHCFDDD